MPYNSLHLERCQRGSPPHRNRWWMALTERLAVKKTTAISNFRKDVSTAARRIAIGGWMALTERLAVDFRICFL